MSTSTSNSPALRLPRRKSYLTRRASARQQARTTRPMRSRQALKQAPQDKTHAMVRLLARIMGIGIDTADMLVHEVLARNLRDRAVGRYAGLTGSPDESGSRRREKGLAK